MPEFFRLWLETLPGERGEELARWMDSDPDAPMDTILFLLDRGQRFPEWQPGVGSSY